MGSKPRQDSALPDSVTEAAAEIETSIDAADRAVSAIRADIEAQDDDGVTGGNGDQLTAERMREITELTDGLIEQVKQVRRRSQALLTSLDQASRRIGELTDDVAHGSDEPAIGVAPSGSARAEVPVPAPAETVAGELEATTDTITRSPQLGLGDDHDQPPTRAAHPKRYPDETSRRQPGTPAHSHAAEPGREEIPGQPDSNRKPANAAAERASQMVSAGAVRDEIIWVLRNEFDAPNPGAIVDRAIEDVLAETAPGGPPPKRERWWRKASA